MIFFTSDECGLTHRRRKRGGGGARGGPGPPII